jgi:putative flippase GtrA
MKEFFNKHQKIILYLVSSLSSFIIDILIFTILKIIFKNIFTSYIYIATFIARALSSYYNYLFNKRIVFKSSNKLTIIKYYLLVICNVILSAFLVNNIYKITNINETIIKIFIDLFIFCSSYIFQKYLIFRKKV